MIHLITTLQIHGDLIRDQRSVGYYETYERACEAVCENRCDIYEGCYNYAIIESVPSGIYPDVVTTHWFHVVKGESEEEITYTEVEKPKFAEHLCICGIG